MGPRLVLPVWAKRGWGGGGTAWPPSPAVPGGSWKDESLTCREEVLLMGSGTGARRLGGFFL